MTELACKKEWWLYTTVNAESAKVLKDAQAKWGSLGIPSGYTEGQWREVFRLIKNDRRLQQGKNR